MKKNSFVEGTFIATLAVIITKIIGVIYVIPFYKIIGEQGGALYAYAYNVYQIFLSISTAGIPVALSKLVSEYNALEKQDAKQRVYKVGRNMLFITSVILFVLLFVFAEEFARLILGNITDGNKIEDIVFVIRCIDFCLLIIPFLSISRGYLQGHRYITYPSISQVIEQIVRVFVILCGSYLILKVFNGTLSQAVGISVFAAFLGGLAALIYLQTKIVKNKKELNNSKIKKDKDITNKEILIKIIKYAIPFIFVTVTTDIFAFVDMILLNRGLYMLNYNGVAIETITTITTTWAPKISVIVNSIAIGMCMSLIPYIVESYVNKDYEGVNHKFNKALQIIIFTSVPMVVGLIILASPVFNLFYGDIIYGPGIFRIVLINTFFWNIFLITNMVLQSLNRFKLVYILTILSCVLNAILDIPCILLFNKLGIPPYFGATFATIISTALSLLISLLKLKKEFNLSFKPVLKTTGKLIIPTLSMCAVLYILSLFIPLTNLTYIQNILVSVLYALVGAPIFIYLTYKNGSLQYVLGEDILEKFIRKFKKAK